MVIFRAKGYLLLQDRFFLEKNGRIIYKFKQNRREGYQIRRIIGWNILIILLVIGFSSSGLAFSTTGFEFELYNNPNAENVALNIAKMQDELENPDEGEDPMDMFKDMLITQIFSRFAQNITESIFGDGELMTGTYQFENYRVVVTDTGEGVRVEVEDTLTGETTIIEMPYYNYNGVSG